MVDPQIILIIIAVESFGKIRIGKINDNAKINFEINVAIVDFQISFSE